MKLSIITVNQNNSSGLKKTCLSVTTQTLKDLEWIIIDGASEDSSVDIIKQYSSHISYWISEPDSGIYNAMNKGIKKATGEYLLFLNSGDYLIHPWTLQEVMDEIKISASADVYFCDTVLNTYQVLKLPENVGLNFFLDEMINHQNCLIKRELFKTRLYNEDYHILADWHFFLNEILKQNIVFLHIKTNIAVYNMNGISNNSEKRRTERKKMLEELNIVKEAKKKERIYFIINIFERIRYILPYGLYRLIQRFGNYLRRH